MESRGEKIMEAIEKKETKDLMVKVSKRKDGSYDWEIKVFANEEKEILEKIDSINKQLKEKYGGVIKK